MEITSKSYLSLSKVNKDLGRISDLEFSLYESLLNNMMEELNEIPKKSPDLMIYLSGSFETILNRIKKRGREYELDEGLVSYYYELWKGYDQWIYEHYKASEVLVINIDEFDYVNNEEHKRISEQSELCSDVARLTGFEPATPRIGILCSIQLSYRRIY